MSDITGERHPKYNVNKTDFDSDNLFVNALLNPLVNLDKYTKNKTGTFAIVSEGRLVAARLAREDAEYVCDCCMNAHAIDTRRLGAQEILSVGPRLQADELDGQDNKIEKNNSSIPLLISWPWELITLLPDLLKKHLESITSEKHQSTECGLNGVKKLGSQNLIIETGASIEAGTILDTTDGAIYIGRDARIAPARISGPIYISQDAQIRQFSLISQCYIGKKCKVAGEVELSVISDYTNKAHAGFVGHSYIGEWVNLGANTTTSDLKMTYGKIKMNPIPSTITERDTKLAKLETGTNKLGSFIGDMSKTSIGTYIYGGTRIGISSHLYGFVTTDVPSFTIYGKGIGANNVELEVESAIETQKRMMSRRNIAMSGALEQLIRKVYLQTSIHREQAQVFKQRFEI